MKVLHDYVLVTEDSTKEKTTEFGLILSSDIATGMKPAVVIAFGDQVEGLEVENKVYLDWKHAMAIELDGLKCGVIKFEHIKLIVD